MTLLSVNVNKIALLRNSRGSGYPRLLDFVEKALILGAPGITVHPRPDERHVTRQDVADITAFLEQSRERFPGVEFNIEGYPSEAFLQLIAQYRPAQCTLVPDEPGQLTSDHGWDTRASGTRLREVLERLRSLGVRSSLFLDPDPVAVEQAAKAGSDRIELYTERYARAFGTADQQAVLAEYGEAAEKALEVGLGVNAGHDLNLENLAEFLRIPGIEEVSIGHALVVESLDQGMDKVIGRYLEITRRATE